MPSARVAGPGLLVLTRGLACPDRVPRAMPLGSLGPLGKRGRPGARARRTGSGWALDWIGRSAARAGSTGAALGHDSRLVLPDWNGLVIGLDHLGSVARSRSRRVSPASFGRVRGLPRQDRPAVSTSSGVPVPASRWPRFRNPGTNAGPASPTRAFRPGIRLRPNRQSGTAPLLAQQRRWPAPASNRPRASNDAGTAHSSDRWLQQRRWRHPLPPDRRLSNDAARPTERDYPRVPATQPVPAAAPTRPPVRTSAQPRVRPHTDVPCPSPRHGNARRSRRTLGKPDPTHRHNADLGEMPRSSTDPERIPTTPALLHDDYYRLPRLDRLAEAISFANAPERPHRSNMPAAQSE